LIKLTYLGCTKLERVIYVGAEAVVGLGYYLGTRAIYKLRIPKPYRDPSLDKLIRSERTLNESRILINSRRLNVNVPKLLLVDVTTSLIIMEYIEGKLLRDVLNTLDMSEVIRISYIVGKQVGTLHKNSIVHGDLTTSNMILGRDGNVYLIDFGLSKYSNDLEDYGVDIHLFMRSLESVHHRLKDVILGHFLKGYEDVVGKEFREEVEDKVREIRLRGRYVEERRRR